MARWRTRAVIAVLALGTVLVAVAVVLGSGVRKSVTASLKRSFVAVLAGVDSCESVTVRATGSRGSLASFNLSAGIVCR